MHLIQTAILVVTVLVTFPALSNQRSVEVEGMPGVGTCSELLRGILLGERDLDQSLVPEFLRMKSNPSELSQYIRNIVGYDADAARTRHIPYLAALVPHFLNIFERIPLHERIRIQARVLNPAPWERNIARDFGSIDVAQMLESAKKNLRNNNVTIPWFNEFVLKVLFYEAIYRYPPEDDDYSWHLLELSKGVGYSQPGNASSIPWITFNTLEPSLFIQYWRHGIVPISVLDTKADPYDGIAPSDQDRRSRFGFAVHDVTHAISFSFFMMSLGNLMESKVPLYSIRKYFWRADAPSEVFALRLALDRFENRLQRIGDLDRRLFLHNFLYIFIHESLILREETAEALLAASGLIKLSKFKVDALKRNLLNSQIISSREFSDPSRLLWAVPQAWRGKSWSESPVRESISQFVDVLVNNR